MNKLLILSLLLFTISNVVTSKIFAQPGSLDHSFSFDGEVVTQIGINNSNPTSLAIQSDGKIVVVGVSSPDFTLVRYNVDGSIDSSFGTNGVVVTSIGLYEDLAKTVAIQSDGKIVVGGSSNDSIYPQMALVRYTADGLLDTSFNGNGIIILSMGAGGKGDINSLVLQNDGKIVVVGYACTNSSFFSQIAVLRYTTNGLLDTTFNHTGMVFTKIYSVGGDVGERVALQTDGKIVVNGKANNVGSTGGPSGVVTLRYHVNGSLDTSFSNNGYIVAIMIPPTSQINSIAVQNDGKILLGGYWSNNPNCNILLARYDSTGNIDVSFGTTNNSVVVTPIGDYQFSLGFSARLQNDGKIVVAGYSFTHGVGLARYTTDGILDTTFDHDGIMYSNTLTGSVSDLALQTDGKIVVAGYSDLGFFSHHFDILRFNGDYPLSTNNIIPESDPSVFPNPFNQSTTICFNHFLSNATIHIYNSRGLVVDKIEHISGQKITYRNIHLPSGVYFIEILDKDFSFSKTKITISN